MEEIPIPDYLNVQPSFFWWELDEFIVMCCIIVIGYIMGGIWPVGGLAAGVYVAKCIKKWKSGELDGALQHILFDKGIISMNKLYKNSNNRSLWV